MVREPNKPWSRSVDGTQIEKARFIGTWPKGVEPMP